MKATLKVSLLSGLLLLAACSSEPLGPAELDAKNEQCANCRMAVSDAEFASQIVAPGEIPLFFDDLGCLVEYLEAPGKGPRGAAAWVADHRTRGWVRADAAIYTRVPELDTPMNSHLVAHADEASREADPAARGGTPVPVTELFGAGGPPVGASP